MKIPMSDANQELRLKRINDKGWEVAQRLMKVKANQNLNLDDIKGLKMDDTGETPEPRLRRFLDQINQARARLTGGDYGKCQRCGAPFSDPALDEMPWVELCRACDAL